MVINYKNNKFIATLFFLALISFLTTIDNFALQTAVDGGLILSKKVIYPDEFSNVTAIYLNSWTLLHHITSILLNFNLSVVVISKLLMFISTIFYSFGIFFIVNNLTKNLIVSYFLVCFILITKINFGSVDYPALLFSEHTYGMFSLSTFTLLIGLLFNKNFKLAGFISIVLLSFHLIVGLWVILLLILVTKYLQIINNKKIIVYEPCKKNFYKGLYIGLIPTIISFIIYQLNTVSQNDYNKDDFQTYLNLWDHHRNISEINYFYILLTLILVFLFFIIVNNIKKKNLYDKFLFLFISSHCFFSLIIYLSYKIFPQFYPELFIRAMITRVFLLHSIIGYPLIISFIYIFFSKGIDIKYNSKKFLKIILSLTVFSVFTVIYKYESRTYKGDKDLYEKINYRVEKIKKNFSNSLNYEEYIFWQKVKNLNTDGYFVTTFNSSEPTLKFANKPYIINAKFFDHLPYHPYTVDEVKMIIENIYGINFLNPPINYWPEIRDEWISEKFELRSKNQWLELSKEFNLSAIIVPSSWNLKIQKTITSKKFTLYKLQ